MLDSIVTNFTSAPLLFFILGFVAFLVKSDLRMPKGAGTFIVIFLMAAIGLKAGVEISKMPGGLIAVAPFALKALVFGVLIVIMSFYIMSKWLRLDFQNSCALAASFGAVSTATLLISISMLESLKIPYEAFMPALYPFMDSPAIIAALFVAKNSLNKKNKTQVNIISENGEASKTWGALIGESFTNSGVFVLLGCMIIGLISGPAGLESEMNLFRTLFRGMLCLFLLDMGIVAASRIGELRRVTPLIIPFAIFISVISGVASVFAASWLGLSVGGAVVFAALAAGASYVTVPAAMRVSMPEANPSLYIGTAIGVIFPWNVLFGLPLYLELAQFLAR